MKHELIVAHPQAFRPITRAPRGVDPKKKQLAMGKVVPTISPPLVCQTITAMKISVRFYLTDTYQLNSTAYLAFSI